MIMVVTMTTCLCDNECFLKLKRKYLCKPQAVQTETVHILSPTGYDISSDNLLWSFLSWELSKEVAIRAGNMPYVPHLHQTPHFNPNSCCR